MKTSLNWLKEYVPVTETAQEISALLSNIGFNTESIEQAGDDTVIDFEITSNRPDCLSHIGIAREIAAVTTDALIELVFRNEIHQLRKNDTLGIHQPVL